MTFKHGAYASLNYMDTEFLTYNIKTNEFYNVVLNDIDKYLNTPDIPFTNINNISTKNGKILRQFIGLRS